MTERTNIPVSENNRIFHTLHYNFSEDKIPLQYAMELNTLDLPEAEEKKKKILTALKLVDIIETNIKTLNERIESQDTDFDKYGWKRDLVRSIHNSNISDRNLLQQILKSASS